MRRIFYLSCWAGGLLAAAYCGLAALLPMVKAQTGETLQAPTNPPQSTGLPSVKKDTGDKPAGDLQTLHKLAAESYSSINCYLVRFKRREQVAGKDMPEELMLMKFREQPRSIYMKWLAEVGHGRELIYVQGKFDDKLHIRLAAGDILLLPAGKKMSFALDSPLVRAKSRHLITEAGVGQSIEMFGSLVKDLNNKDDRSGSLKYLGLVKRPEFEGKVEGVLQTIPPKSENTLPRGGQRYWYFDTRLRFPVLLVTFDEKQHEVEYYCFDRWYFPGQFFEDEFNPNVLWREN
jgi:hypothetical protein